MRYLVWLNCLLALAFLATIAYIHVAMPLSANLCVTKLDRAGVINEAALKEMSPWLAENIRGRLGAWIAKTEHTAAMMCGAFCVLVALGNAVGLYFLIPAEARKLSRRVRVVVIVAAVVVFLMLLALTRFACTPLGPTRVTHFQVGQ